MQNPKEQGLTLTIIEAARILRISRSTAYEAARTGQLPTVKFGRVIRVSRFALERLLSKEVPIGNGDKPE